MIMHSRKAFSLIELIVVIGILGIVTLGIYGSWQSIVHVLQGTKLRTTASEIASERLEIIRNMLYVRVGIKQGVPDGDIPREETIIRNQTPYTVLTDVRYIDDPFDGVAPLDLLNTDYKQVRVEVRWKGYESKKPVIMWTNISPKGIETSEGGGTLNIEVIDADPLPVEGAFVRIVNLLKEKDLVLQTDDRGIVLIPGMPADTEGYQISISKDGFNSSQTYSQDDLTNPHPDPSHLSVQEGNVTSKVFTIDEVSSISISALDDSEDPVEGIHFTLAGAKHIGFDGDGKPIIKYQQQHVTNAQGKIDLSNMEFDTYSISLNQAALDGFDLSNSSHPPSFIVPPHAVESIILHLKPHTDNTILVYVHDGETALSGVSIKLSSLEFEQLVQSSSTGYAFFSGLSSGSYSIEASFAEYQTFLSDISVQGSSLYNIPMTK